MDRKQFSPILALGIALCTAVFGLTPAMAQKAVRTYRIEAQPLGTALKQFAKASGVEVLFSEADVTGKQAPALDGQYDRDAAITRLLSSSGLKYTAAGPNTIVVQVTQRTNTQSSSAPEPGGPLPQPYPDDRERGIRGEKK